MSILAQNLKTIRKQLGCTQSVMADILKVGFRTFVRYEAGERDAPASVLVKISKLGNLSLEQLLTTELDRYDIAPLKTVPKNVTTPEIKQVNFRSGQVMFKKPVRQELLTVDDEERKLISVFRKMEPDLQKRCLSSTGKPLMDEMTLAKAKSRGRKAKAKVLKKGSAKKASAKRAAFAAKTKKKGRPGRKKLDRKLLKEKIDKLKMITRSVHKITVR